MARRENVFIRAAAGGALNGTPGRVITFDRVARMFLVELLRNVGTSFVQGEVIKVPEAEVVEQLQAGDQVAYAPAHLRANRADAREYGRTGVVRRQMEGTLVQVEWADGLGPSVLSTFQLSRVRP
jgi:hypothetical protein